MSERELTPEKLMERVADKTAEIEAREKLEDVRRERQEGIEWHRVTVEAKRQEGRESATEALLNEAVTKVNEQTLRQTKMAADRYAREEEWLKTVDAAHGYVVFSEDVTSEGVLSFSTHLRRWSRLAGSGAELTVELNSPGGEIVAGLALFDTLMELRKIHPLTVKVRGEACSMAGVLLQAGANRIIGKHAYIMLHRASFGAAGTADEVEDTVERTKMYENTIYGILADRSGKSATAWKAALGKRKDVWYTAEQAVKAGLADAIG